MDEQPIDMILLAEKSNLNGEENFSVLVRKGYLGKYKGYANEEREFYRSSQDYWKERLQL